MQKMESYAMIFLFKFCFNQSFIDNHKNVMFSDHLFDHLHNTLILDF